METLGPDSKGLERQMERERSNMEKGGGVGVQGIGEICNFRIRSCQWLNPARRFVTHLT